VLEIRHAMADISIAHVMPKGPRKRSSILKGVKSNNPNDVAIKLVTRLCAFEAQTWIEGTHDGPFFAL
jgi:hypothetical protein